ncbi:hypothetical protein SEA_CAMERICO_45 [Gordonia phage Camerico]|nr:hypothetical protein SEA_CAMERICO_45 [Gordonia phage Camerico]
MGNKKSNTCTNPKCKGQIYPTIESVEYKGRMIHSVVWLHRENDNRACPVHSTYTVE